MRRIFTASCPHGLDTVCSNTTTQHIQKTTGRVYSCGGLKATPQTVPMGLRPCFELPHVQRKRKAQHRHRGSQPRLGRMFLASIGSILQLIRGSLRSEYDECDAKTEFGADYFQALHSSCVCEDVETPGCTLGSREFGSFTTSSLASLALHWHRANTADIHWYLSQATP